MEEKPHEDEEICRCGGCRLHGRFSGCLRFHRKHQQRCRFESTEGATAEAAAETTATGSGFTVQLGPNPETLDPALNSSVDGANTIITIFEPLLLIDEETRLFLARLRATKKARTA